MPNTRLGVGFLGAGAVTQAIHLPTLARLSEQFEVTHVTDISADTAETVAARVGAAHSTTTEELLADPRVDVVAVCSPHFLHAVQVVAACRAGARAVLCEKPLAMSEEEADEIATAAAQTGVPVLVGAMHAFDPGWRAAVAHWGSLPEGSHMIRSSIVLPPNSRFEDFATEVPRRPAGPQHDTSDPEAQARMLHGGIMGLAVHDLPLVRALLPRVDDLVVHSAHALDPFGYRVVLTVGGKRVELHGLVSASWRPEWVLEAYSDDQALHVEFPPSYVHAGSATATLRSAGSARVFGPAPHNGYEGEWREVAAVVAGHRPPPPVGGLVEDLRFALAVADAAAERFLGRHFDGALV